MIAASQECPVEAYARAVVGGEIVAGRLVRLACVRHLKDLESGHERGLRFDHRAANRGLEFFSFLKLPEGDRPFDLAPWQKFVVGCLLGWKGPDGYRRFRTSYIEAGKGCGKTPMAAGLGLYGVVADGEASAEVYTAGVTRDQATYLLNDAIRLVEASPELKKQVVVGANNLAIPSSNSFMRPVSSEGRTLDQKRVHMALLDEVHEHPTPVVVEKMGAGVKGRKQPLIIEITNSGSDRTTICWHHHEYSEKVLLGILEDDSWFAYVCTLDACQKCADEGKTQPTDGCPHCDDWRKEEVWIKANPSLDIGIPGRKYLSEQVRAAEGMPTKAYYVKRLNFCLWTETANRCIPIDQWEACASAIVPESLKGRACFGGLDIGASSDFTAFVLVFPHDDAEDVEVEDGVEKKFIKRRSFTVLPWFWLPERPLKRDAKTQQAIDAWRDAGFIRTTGGSVVDYDQVLEEILEIAQQYRLVKIAVDRGFQGSQMCNNLMKHFGEDDVRQFAQGVLSMNAPFRELLELLAVGRLHHDGNPVLQWMASNVAPETRGGLIKPSKDVSSEKIDGITALTMALGISIIEDSSPSIYSQPGNLAL